MGLGSYVLYLRALKDGITPREVAAEIKLPEHYIHAIELEKHAGDSDSRTKLAEYFTVSVDDFSDYARSNHSRFLEMLKKERRPQVGFLLMSGETLVGTVDGADHSIVKIVELNNGTKTILQRHAIKKWWPLKPRSERGEGDRPGNRAGGDRRPMGAGGDRNNRGPRPGGPPRAPGGPPGNNTGPRPPRPGQGGNTGPRTFNNGGSSGGNSTFRRPGGPPPSGGNTGPRPPRPNQG